MFFRVRPGRVRNVLYQWAESNDGRIGHRGRNGSKGNDKSCENLSLQLSFVPPARTEHAQVHVRTDVMEIINIIKEFIALVCVMSSARQSMLRTDEENKIRSEFDLLNMLNKNKATITLSFRLHNTI